jgi:hypothetical protein
MEKTSCSQISLGLITVVTLGPTVACLIANYCVLAPWLPIVLGSFTDEHRTLKSTTHTK